MSSEDYVNIRQIGKGAFGTAHIVQHKVTGERFVLKRVRLARQSARERQSSVKELLLLSNLRHRNVLEFKGCWVEGGCNLCLLVELCESGDLFTQLRLRHPTSLHFSEEHLQEMAVQLLSALAYLHRSNIAHRDLKTANVLITGDGCLKLADFGLSTVLELETNRLTKTMVGTPNYMSPCVLQDKPYGTPNDIWGLGCVLFELSALKPAFQAFNMAGLIKKVISGTPPPMPSCYSEHWRNLVRAMLTREAQQRPSAEELLELEWLQPAVRRVSARFGPELPPGAPELLERLSDLPPDIMALLDAFQAQEKEEKRRADEARERRKAAVAKWDPIARAAAAAQAAAAAAAKQPKLPPLKPHVPRKPQPRPSRAPGGPGGPPPRAVPPLPPGGGGGDDAASPRMATVGTAAPNKVGARRKTYCGDSIAAGGGGAVHDGFGGRSSVAPMPGHTAAAAGGGGGLSSVPRRLPLTLPGAATTVMTGEGGICRSRPAAAAWLGHGPRPIPPLLPLGRFPAVQRPALDGHGSGGGGGARATQAPLPSSWLRTRRPSSAPPDSPVRRTRRGVPEGGGAVAGDPRVCGLGLNGTSPAGSGSRDHDCDRDRRNSSCGDDLASALSASAPDVSGSCPQLASSGSASLEVFSGSVVSPLEEALSRKSWQQQQQQQKMQQRQNHSQQQQRQEHKPRPQDAAAAAAAASGAAGGAGGAGRVSAAGEGRGTVPLAGKRPPQPPPYPPRHHPHLNLHPQQPHPQQHGQDPTALITSESGMREDSEVTFRYLPPMRDISSHLGQSGTGSSDDEYGADDCERTVGECDASKDDGAGAVRQSCCPATLPPPRRANSEMVLWTSAAESTAAAGPTPPRENQAPGPTTAQAMTPVDAAAAASSSFASASGARAAAAAATAAAAAGGDGRPSATDAAGKAGSRRPSDASVTSVGSGGGGTGRGRGRRPSSGLVSGSAAAVQPRTSSGAGQSIRRPTVTGYGNGSGGAAGAAAAGSRRSTLTNSGLGLGSGPGPAGSDASHAIRAAAAASGGGGAVGDNRDEASVRKGPRASSSLPAGGRRPSTASSSALSRPTSAKHQQQQQQQQLQQKASVPPKTAAAIAVAGN